MSEFTILFTSAGRRVSLIDHFSRTLKNMGLEGKIIAADLQKNAPALFFADTQVVVPRVTDADYIEKILQLCAKHRVTLLIPLIDTELHIFAPHQKQFKEIGVTLLVSSPETIDICFDKRNTFHFFKQNNISTPEILDLETVLNNPNQQYPLLIKPADGSCSKGVTKIFNAKELQFFIEYIPNAIIQEYLDGDEYTLDILVDFQGKVRLVVPRLRIETRAGEISKGLTVKNRKIMEAGTNVVKSLPGTVGCITLQCFLQPNGEIKFIEINPRFGGGIPLSLNAGADFARRIIEWVLGQDTESSPDDWQDGLMMLRYDDAVFVKKETIE